MNNVSSIFGKNAHTFGGFGPADFDIETKPLVYSYGEEYHESSKSVILRKDTGDELGIHSHKYKAIAPKKAIQAARDIILRSDLDTTDIIESIRTSHDGARTFVKYDLPAHTYKTADGDSASLSLLATTSFDSSWPFMISVAGHQWACLNTQVFVSGAVAIFKAKHTAGLNIDEGSRIIIKCLDTFNNERKLWDEWNKTTITQNEAFEAIVDAANCRKAVNKLRIETPGINNVNLLMSLPRTNNNLTYLVQAWRKYSVNLGKTRWGLYNALTDWSTHCQTVSKKQENNISSVKSQRQEIVRAVIKHHFSIAA